MRKFFKSLAVLLALTLIVGVIPAAAADSLSMAKEKILYLDGSKGQKEDGTLCKTGSKKLVANMIKGFDKDTMSVVLSSADKDIVKTTKTGRIKAVSLGTTTVTVQVLNADEEQIFQQDLKVKVKKNATDITVTGIADGDKFSVGQSVDVTLPRAGVDTDERELTVDKTDVAEIKAGEKARTYTVKFLKDGEATFTAKAYQSAKYPVATQSKTIKVTVGKPAPVAVKAVASNAYELTFDTDVEAAGIFKSQKEIPDDACYYLNSDVKIPFTGVSEVKAKGNTVKVTMFNSFVAGTTYYVVVNGCDPLEFAIAGNKAKDVEYVVINTSTLVKDDIKAGNVSVSLFNKDNVDITKTVIDSGEGSLALTSSDNLKLWAQDSSTATMYNVGDTADLTATFTFYDPNNNWEPKVLKATKTITCIAAAVAQKTGLIYTVGGSKSSPKTYLAIGDTPTFNAWLKETLNGTTKEKQVGKEAFGNVGPTYARIADTSIAMITADDGNGNYTIKGNQVGSTYVFICYTKDNKEVIFDSCPIEVRAARFAQNVALTISKSNLNCNANVSDSVKITAKVTDNYNDAYDLPNSAVPTIEQISASKTVATLKDENSVFFTRDKLGEYSVIISRNSFASIANKDGAVALTVKAGDKSNKPTVSFSVRDKGDVAGSYSFAVDKTSIDTSINKIKTPVVTAKVSLEGVKEGYFVASQAITEVLAGNKATPVNSTVANYTTVSGAGFILDIKKDNSRVDLTKVIDDGVAYSQLVVVDKLSGTVTLKSYVAGANKIVKLPKGNYTFELYVIKAGKIDGSIRRVNVTVSDNQVAPTFTKKEQVISKTTGGTAIECFEFAFDGSKDNVKSAVIPGDGSTHDPKNLTTFVKKADVTMAITDNDGKATGNLVLSVDVNTLLND